MRDLGSREAIVNIAAIIENSGIAPSRIDLEVTETALIQDFDQANASLRTLKALGVGISLDDFGTGYSSLSYVQQFPIDKIKIDRSFVKEVETRRFLPRHRQIGDRPVPQPQARLHRRRHGNRQPSGRSAFAGLHDNARISLQQADAGG